ncbi:MAG: type IV pilus twitching motility protein PilT [Candidatus Eremiobacteraeota bacterium]|nr:type IV pilus twitching motility protein PilT [Candidatus Eremiobacteraeota bacterium]MCW5869463.1 type IV pilus twitching motility protein PilT [Candidatus Eremiobacteraeota bacterium]
MLELMVDSEGSDLHLSVGNPPALRVHGRLIFTEAPVFDQARAEALLLPLVSKDKAASFQQTGHLDFSHEIPNLARFRGNLFRQQRGMAAVFRVIPKNIPTIDQLKLPAVIRTLCQEHQGLILVTGPTGSGKSTTLASMINFINQTRQAHIITIEDPIEFFHKSQKSLIDHREVGEHVLSFADGLRASLREDPDIILVGEMRDLETIYNAIKAAETGHLVFATLHTNSAAKTVDRIIDVFPGKQQPQIRAMLSESLKAVIAQQLLRTIGGSGRVAAHEILISRSGFPALVREAKTSQINNYIMTNRDEGMQSMDACLVELLKQKRISLDTAKDIMTDPLFFKNQGFPVEVPH